MHFRIADIFTDSLAHLTGDEQKAVKTTAFDLQINPANPGMQLHKLDKARDKNFWSVRVSRDIRIIVHRTAQGMLLCYTGHHDDAYHWAECRKIETHPTTGAAQIVEIRETIKHITVPQYAAPQQEKLIPRWFENVTDGDMLSWGVPEDWLKDVRAIGSEDELLKLTEHLPAEAAEALLEVATGGTPRPLISAPKPADPFAHPDAQRRFRIVTDRDELERALEAPWDKWTIFLHPAQREWVDRDYTGPARVSGSAGTGKTVVALHRAVHLVRQYPDGRVLLATFSDALANALRVNLRKLLGPQPRLGERIDVYAMDAVGERLYRASHGELRLATYEEIGGLLEAASAAHPGHGFTAGFLRSEWENVVDGWQLASWEAYRDVQRLGRKTRLPEARREVLWTIFEDVRNELQRRGWLTRAGMFASLAAELTQRSRPPYDFAVIDEAQDINVAQMQFLAALGAGRPNALFFAGDTGQRIFRQPFSWKSMGVDIRGRARTLHVNYRTSHQIRAQADRLLDPVVADVDGIEEERKGTVSVFNGPKPDIQTYADARAESTAVGAWLGMRIKEGLAPHEIAVFVRSGGELDRARDAVANADLTVQVLDERVETVPAKVSISTMHLAKGLEFRAVAVMACDDEIIPLQQRINEIADEADLTDVYETERHLLYVACTRARDYLLVSGVNPTSEFLEDMTD